MSSAEQKGEIPQTHRTVLLPGNPTSTKPYINDQEAQPRTSDVDHDSQHSSEGWKPRLDRRQSWNEEDRKHELQAWLLGVEEGRETGFTESSNEI
ncbi:hypothetical protein BDV33DRAFT_164476 [Aspergillus novoparasiticus]|uniref:Uncharacterized protein n=1 Tax=Aspergillus novoparasiticus TaxID=986946 RepID=A0A5N6F5Y0_9EURO|nr:hypothetical protein BDV33DRAFT_164476 [Aspergillus novoparasiticus]